MIRQSSPKRSGNDGETNSSQKNTMKTVHKSMFSPIVKPVQQQYVPYIFITLAIVLIPLFRSVWHSYKN